MPGQQRTKYHDLPMPFHNLSGVLTEPCLEKNMFLCQLTTCCKRLPILSEPSYLSEAFQQAQQVKGWVGDDTIMTMTHLTN